MSGVGIGLGMAMGSRTAASADPEFARDTFAGADGTALQDHAPERGGPWSRHPLAANSLLLEGGRVRGSGGITRYILAAVPAGPDQLVEADLVLVTDNNSTEMGVIGRCDPVAMTNYVALYRTTTNLWRLAKVIAGASSVQIGSTVGQTLTPLQPYRLGLRMQGTTIELLVDGEVIISATDADIADAGRVGLYSNHTDPLAGPRIDNFVARVL
jgi:hypothetical protein